MDNLRQPITYLYNGFTSSEIAARLALPVVFILILAVSDPAQVLASEVDPAPHRLAGWSR